LRLFSYIVDRDYGFAPNPFFGRCTLATCKPKIRKGANIGDWIIGTGGSKRKRSGFITFAMCVSEAMTYNEYWEDPRFQQKKPNLRGSIKQAFGDNIYYEDGRGHWHQLDSHHSYVGGSPNPHNVKNDTQTDRILVSTDYVYWGGSGPEIPSRLRNWDGIDICAGRGHKNRFPDKLVNEFIAWFKSLDAHGYRGEPLEWSRKR
jgi:hypothetical protein